MAETEARHARATVLETEEAAPKPAGLQSLLERMISDQSLLGQSQPTLSQLAADPNALAVVEREYQALLARQNAAIALTDPGDWVGFKDAEDNVTYRPRASAMKKARGLFPFTMKPAEGRADTSPFPIEVPTADGGMKKGLRCLGYAWSDKMMYGFDVETTKLEGEDWTGRKVDAEGNITTKRGESVSHEGDQRLAARTALELKAFIGFSGLDRLPAERLEAVWSRLAPPKSLSQLGKGAGYGSADKRRATKVQDPEVKTEADKIWTDILRRVAGDEQKASQVLFDITVSVNEPPKYGIRSPSEFFKVDQFKYAWTRLKKHPEYGDQAGGGA